MCFGKRVVHNLVIHSVYHKHIVMRKRTIEITLFLVLAGICAALY